MEASYPLPVRGWAGPWYLDLVNEGIAWFGVRAPVVVPTE